MRGAVLRAALAAGLLLAGLTFALLSGCALEENYDKFAIVYGVSDYEGAGYDLTYPDDDALAMQAMLTTQGYQVWMRTDAAATKANLLADVASAGALAGEQDLFVFYFSGHGGQFGYGPEGEGGDNLNEYIFLRDSLSDLNLTFSDDQLVQAFAPIASRKKVIIIDACNSGGFIGNALEADGEPAALVEGSDGILERAATAIRLYANFDHENTADIPPWEALVLSAAGERDLSSEMGSPYNHGVFTYYLLAAEHEGDRDGDGLLTVTEAFAYTQDMINREWNYMYGFPSDVFSPHVSGGPVDYVLLEAR
jgi:uncharacterized caspase-like protein